MMFAIGVCLSAICLRLLRHHESAETPRQSPFSIEIPVS
jgi:hypothetical protein